MNVTGHLQKVVVRINQKSLVSPLVQMAYPVVPLIEKGGVGYVEMAHKLGKVAVRSGQQEVKMVGHQNIGEDRHIVRV